jgi:CheY-like chemotaxis protein
MDRPARYTILLLEDTEEDVILMKRALRKNGISNPVQVLSDGQEGIEYMQGVGKFSDRLKFPMPDVVILDIKMPRKSGLEFLEWMHDHPELRVIPTVVLSSSHADSDVARAYSLNANTYFVKPNNFDEFVKLVGVMEQYWNNAIKPTRGR